MDINDKLNKLEESLEKKLSDAEKRVGERLTELDKDAIKNQPESNKSRSFQTLILAGDEASSLESSSGARGPIPLVHDAEIAGLYLPRKSEIEQSMAFVQHSPRIAENVLYRQRAESISFYYLEGNVVNAFATDGPIELDNGEILKPPLIVFFGGLARALCLTSTALALQQVIRSNQYTGPSMDFVRDAIERIGKSVVASSGSLSQEAAEGIFHDVFIEHVQRKAIGGRSQNPDESYIELAKTLRSSMYMFVIGHELGHIAYGHTLGPNASFEVSRRQEFDADSFALQTLTESPFSKYTFLGQVFVTLIFAWMNHAAGDQAASSHPLAKDRFQELFKDPDSRAAKQIAEEFGLSKERLEDLLPSN